MLNLPEYKNIQIDQIESELKQNLQKNREQLATILSQKSDFDWKNLMEPLSVLDNNLSQFWSPISHLHAVVSSKALRNAYKHCLESVTEYHTEIAQNKNLYLAIKSLSESADYQSYDIAQQKVIEHELRDFRLSGVSLDEKAKKTYKALNQQLSKLSNQFSENVLEATDAWSMCIDDEEMLSGLPEHALLAAKKAAKEKNKKGWLFNLEFPSYFAVITFADVRSLREKIYRAYSTRASEQGPHAGQWDNSEIMSDIVALRHQLANLVGFSSYADYSLATKMADTPEEVLQFLNDLVRRAKPQAEKEYAELQDFAKSTGDISALEAWDMTYYSEKLRQQNFDLSQEELRPYFPENKVLEGLFEITKRLYGITVKEKKGVDVWHKDAHFYELYKEDGTLCGGLYMDLYARANKRGGAWMDEQCVRWRLPNGELQMPVAYLTCNFSAPAENQPALFNHEDVLTLFHEFGHCLHHLLTQVEHYLVSGINGVPWDAVECPSQFYENWCYHKEALTLLTSHFETGESLPQPLFEKLHAANNFQSGMTLLRQCEFSLFDFKMHLDYEPENPKPIQQVLNEVREQVSVVPVPDFNRFQHGFSHIFAGGYAAGYYSYKWAEVLSADAFSKFEEKGIFDKATGRLFLNTILAQGGSREPMDLFIEFRGRKPDIAALLKHNGIES